MRLFSPLVKRRRAGGTVLLAAVIALLPSAPVVAHGSSGNHGNCREYVLPVALEADGPKDQQIDVTYCSSKKHGKDKIVVTTPGATYTKTYFDWPQKPRQYSYAYAAMEAGLSVLTYTPVGRVTDKSSRPHSSELTLARNVQVLRQVIDHVAGQGYRDIFSMGHSVGAGVALAEAAIDPRVDGLILSGYAHRQRNPTFAAQYNHPANQDPAFQGLSLDSGYSTTRPGVRGEAFYGTVASRQVVKYDETHKDVVSGVLVGGYAADHSAPPETSIARQIRRPVLIVVGTEDKIFCTTTAQPACDDQPGMTALEQQYFSEAASVTYEPVRRTGHDLTTATTARYTAHLINNWIRQ